MCMYARFYFIKNVFTAPSPKCKTFSEHRADVCLGCLPAAVSSEQGPLRGGSSATLTPFSVATGTLPPAPVVSPTGIKWCQDRHSPTDPCSCYVFKEGPPLLNACVSQMRNTHLRETCWNTEAHCLPTWSLESRGTKSFFLSIPLEILEFQGFLTIIFKRELFFRTWSFLWNRHKYGITQIFLVSLGASGHLLLCLLCLPDFLGELLHPQAI